LDGGSDTGLLGRNCVFERRQITICFTAGRLLSIRAEFNHTDLRPENEQLAISAEEYTAVDIKRSAFKVDPFDTEPPELAL
jgi:hypothetical protein